MVHVINLSSQPLYASFIIDIIKDLVYYVIKNHIVGIHNIDTRKLTKIIRNEGAQKCIISDLSEDIEYFKNRLVDINNLS